MLQTFGGEGFKLRFIIYESTNLPAKHQAPDDPNGYQPMQPPPSDASRQVRYLAQTALEALAFLGTFR